MTSALYWQTVSPLLKKTLIMLTGSPAFDQFRLVGGTALSLQIGHRSSVDIDLSTDAKYGSIEFNLLDAHLRRAFPFVTDPVPGNVALGHSYLVGKSKNDWVKIDIYYTDAFIQSPIEKDDVRMATIEEIIAMKMDVVQRGGRKKDFWDIHELLDMYSFQSMLQLHERRYPYLHDDELIRSNLANFTSADDDVDPICMRGKHWEVIKVDLIEVARTN